MWPFSKKNKKETPQLSVLLEDRQLLDLTDNKVTLRVWLPEACKQALKETAGVYGWTVSNCLREFFVGYLYGEHERVRMYENDTGLHYVESIENITNRGGSTDGPMFSRGPTIEAIPGLGKNIFPIKIFLPGRIKNDLQLCADKVDIPLSTFVREIMVSHLLGHTLWLGRLRTWTDSEEQTATDWEEGSLESEVVGYSGDSQAKEYLKDKQKVERY